MRETRVLMSSEIQADGARESVDSFAATPSSAANYSSLAESPAMSEENPKRRVYGEQPQSPPSEGVPPAFSEDLALALLKSPDLPAEEIEQLTKNSAVMKSRKVRMAMAAHPRSPRHIALRLIREFYTFDLMRFTLMPGVAADLRRSADDLLVARLASITLGERISLARRSSGRVAAALLLDKESQVWQTALENSRLTEAALISAMQRPAAAPAFVQAVSHHARWSVRPEVRIALLRVAHTPLARALEFARSLSRARLRDVLHTSRLAEKTKAYLRSALLAGSD